MTGTPIENSIMDLWSIVDFVSPGKLGTRDEFRKRYHLPLKDASPGTPERRALRDLLEKEFNPIWMRRTKDDVKNDKVGLPEAVHYDSVRDEKGAPKNIYSVEMSDEQLRYYDNAVSYFAQTVGFVSPESSASAFVGSVLSAISNKALLESCDVATLLDRTICAAFKHRLT